VIASLLAKPVFHDGHAHGWLEVSATAVGLARCGCVLVFVVLLLRLSELGFSVKAAATYRSLWERDTLEQPMVDPAPAEAFEERREENSEASLRSRLLTAVNSRSHRGDGVSARSSASALAVQAPRSMRRTPGRFFDQLFGTADSVSLDREQLREQDADGERLGYPLIAQGGDQGV
jgi:hypothetical protein